jgi:hypothetical protein
MKATPPFTAVSDADLNLVRTRYQGHVRGQDLKEAMPAMEALINSMKPGFTILADLGGLQEMDLDCGPYLARIMDLSRKRGVGKVIRVIPDPSKDIGVNILSIVHYRGKVAIATFENASQAEEELRRG